MPYISHHRRVSLVFAIHLGLHDRYESGDGQCSNHRDENPPSDRRHAVIAVILLWSGPPYRDVFDLPLAHSPFMYMRWCEFLARPGRAGLSGKRASLNFRFRILDCSFRHRHIYDLLIFRAPENINDVRWVHGQYG